jgi:hypothetical protein
MTGTRYLAAVAAALICIAAEANADDKIRIYTSADPILKLGTVTFEGGRDMELSVGIGSGAFRHPSLPGNIFQTVSDRGPNFTCKDGVKLTALSMKRLCGGMKKARIYPMPEYTPSIYTVELLPNSTFRILDVLTVKDASGKPLTGLTNPLKHAKTETPFDARGRKLAQDPGALDMEGMIRLNDGTYWVGEENAPSIVHIAADGRVIKRLVPANTERDFAKAGYKVEGKLPAILARRHTNRGIESMAVSPDEKFLYFSMQSPLDNPDAKIYAKSTNVRLFKFDRAREAVVGEFLYVLDKPNSFIKDSKSKKRKQNAVKVSEMMAVGHDRIIVLERIAKTTKLYEVDLNGATNILNGAYDDVETVPSLEAKAIGTIPVRKALRFNTDDHKGLPAKIEGLARLGDGSTALINDDDFGIDGARTVIATVKTLIPGKQAAAN